MQPRADMITSTGENVAPMLLSAVFLSRHIENMIL